MSANIAKERAEAELARIKPNAGNVTAGNCELAIQFGGSRPQITVHRSQITMNSDLTNDGYCPQITVHCSQVTLH